MAYDWIFNEISKIVKSPPSMINFDPDYLHLRNPNSVKKIDELFYQFFLPEIEKAFSNKLQIYRFKDDNYPNFINKISARLVKEFTFVVEDPENPFSHGLLTKIWYSRFTLELSKLNYILQACLILYLEKDFGLDKIVRLLTNPEFQGLPPELSFEGKYYSLHFSFGRGSGWGLETYEKAADKIYKKIIDMNKIIEFLNKNNKILNSEINFSKLENLLINYFGDVH